MQKVVFLVQVLVLVAISHVAMAGDLPDCDPPPTPVERVPPEYPTVESPIPISGYAVVAFTISQSGNVEDVKLIESDSEPSHSGFSKGFGRSAERAISQWRYAPRPKACRSKQKFTFEIEE
jgi:TonB family protein